MNQKTNNRCYIGLGSNLNNPLQQLRDAKVKISQLPETTLLKCSSIYQSKALTLDDDQQNDYLNAVVEIETALPAESLLDKLQQVENEQGRTREKRWGARTLDLDVLLYGKFQINTQRLTVPHKEIENRNFVLMPLSQISPELEISGKDSLNKMLSNVKNQVLVKVGEFNGKT